MSSGKMTPLALMYLVIITSVLTKPGDGSLTTIATTQATSTTDRDGFGTSSSLATSWNSGSQEYPTGGSPTVSAVPSGHVSSDSTLSTEDPKSITVPFTFTTMPPDEHSKGNKNSRGFSWYPITWSWVLILQLNSAIVGILGNSLVIVVLYQRRHQSRSTDTLISGLACADFLTSLFLIPIPWPAYLPKSWLGEAYCRLIITQSLLWTSITASTYLLMSISIERYIAIVYPLHFKHLVTRHRVSIFIVVIWFISILSGVFVFIVYGVDAATNQCAEQYSLTSSQTIIAYYWFCLRLAVPTVTMLVTQILIARNLNTHSRNLKDITNTGAHGATPSFHIVARNRVIKMMLIVIIIYIVCWTPNQIAYLGYNLGWVPKSYLNSPLHLFLTVIGFYNSCANPVIYTARYPEFRQALKDMFTCTSPQNAPLFEKGDLSKVVSTFKADLESK